ncbi:stage II sporulation protein M [Lacibacter sediminis]|uniref:Stage II sporulation protein M n=1 Tax=Lacibacter sediminis TaxID=2760713 RepID=A0A7G5XB76_9BACT|nr:stage II sporulation protein M [Lacibacter sediminis]QNA42729.1 stage II sporulation protein M [Lacibacter sediminis]
MREALFIKKNAQKWNEYQYLQTEDPDQMADRFITLLDDLSYAKTFYPHSKVTRWINSLAVSIYQTIYQNRKQRFSRLITFWQYELPLMFRKHHRMFLYTFLFFVLLFAMGVLSSMKDDQFVKGVLGEDYVAMTEENIEKGDPFGVYSSESRFAMWVLIAYNNIKVGFLMVAGGILFGIGTLYVFFTNGIMIGSFQYMFFAKGLGWQSVLVIWIHGTLEIAGMIIEACAGFVLARSILFPGTFTRWVSFKRGVKDAMKICVSLIPITILAAFLESYITRLSSNAFDKTTNTSLPVPISISILAVSFLFILWYFVIYPIRLEKRIKTDPAFAEKILA